MPHRDHLLRIQHMLTVAEELLADRGLQYICIHCLELLGEAASQLDMEFRDRHPEVPWRAVIDMRNRLIHGYFDIELSFVWSTITEDLPPLVLQLQSLRSGQ